MDKVWFKLRQTHYPPGPEKAILAGNGDDSHAPLCLGHCIADLKHIDFPINSGAVVAFPMRMNVFQSHVIDFKWERTSGFATSLALVASAPVAAALGLGTVKASVGLAFKRSVSKHEEYERLDTYIVQPSRRYVEQCLETDELKRYIGNKADWSFFLITGIRVARAGKRSGETISQAYAESGTLDRTEKIEEGKVSDFVWAIRLAKIHKGFLMTDWSMGPYTRRATFGQEGEQQVDVGAVVEGEGLSSFQVVEDDDLGEAIVMDAEQWGND
ncbi:hypothetical protein TrVGV298_010104 [Trichoderma virens]|nr:hypothetical protein TrVGV298_010104 [Trichoderma virens]